MSKFSRLRTAVTSRGIERLYNMTPDRQGARDDIRTSSVAGLLALARTGVVFHPESVTQATLDMARVVEEYGVSPDEMQQILFEHEPSLRADIVQKVEPF